MPFNLCEKPCKSCGKPMRRIKYCEECAKIKQRNWAKDNAGHTKYLKGIEIENEGSAFTWDNPGDPWCG